MKQRVQPTWQRPVWTPELNRWTSKQIRQNLWRFDVIEDFDDVMQEARLLFFTLERMYPAASNRPHFFTLYKTSLLRKFIDKTRKKQRTVIGQEQIDDYADSPQLEGTPNYGPASLLLNELPSELKLVLQALTTGRVRLKLNKSTKKLRPRENHNMRLRRRFSLTTLNPVGDLKAYLSNF